MDLPSHPDADDTRIEPSTPTRSPAAVVAVTLLAALLILIILLHLTGVVGPLAH